MTQWTIICDYYFCTCYEWVLCWIHYEPARNETSNSFTFLPSWPKYLRWHSTCLALFFFQLSWHILVSHGKVNSECLYHHTARQRWILRDPLILVQAAVIASCELLSLMGCYCLAHQLYPSLERMRNKREQLIFLNPICWVKAVLENKLIKRMSTQTNHKWLDAIKKPSLILCMFPPVLLFVYRLQHVIHFYPTRTSINACLQH